VTNYTAKAAEALPCSRLPACLKYSSTEHDPYCAALLRPAVAALLREVVEKATDCMASAADVLNIAMRDHGLEEIRGWSGRELRDGIRRLAGEVFRIREGARQDERERCAAIVDVALGVFEEAEAKDEDELTPLVESVASHLATIATAIRNP